MLTMEQEFLKYNGIHAFKSYEYVGIYAGDGKSSKTDDDTCMLHFQLKEDATFKENLDKEILLKIDKLELGKVPPRSGFYLIDYKITRIFL